MEQPEKYPWAANRPGRNAIQVRRSGEKKTGRVREDPPRQPKLTNVKNTRAVTSGAVERDDGRRAYFLPKVPFRKGSP